MRENTNQKNSEYEDFSRDEENIGKGNFLFKHVLSNVGSGYSIGIQNLYIVVLRVIVACQTPQLIIKLKLNYQWFGKEFLLTL